MKKPTGTAEIPLNVLRAKEIKDKISSNEVIGFCEENESDFDGVCDAEDNLDSVTVCKSLTAANLSDASGEVKRPKSNKQKSGKLAEAIKDLGDGQKEADFGLQNAIEAMAKSISGNHGKTEVDDRNDKQRLSNLESDLSSVKEDVSSAHDKLDSILKLLESK